MPPPPVLARVHLPLWIHDQQLLGPRAARCRHRLRRAARQAARRRAAQRCTRVRTTAHHGGPRALTGYAAFRGRCRKQLRCAEQAACSALAAWRGRGGGAGWARVRGAHACARRARVARPGGAWGGRFTGHGLHKELGGMAGGRAQMRAAPTCAPGGGVVHCIRMQHTRERLCARSTRAVGYQSVQEHALPSIELGGQAVGLGHAQ